MRDQRRRELSPSQRGQSTDSRGAAGERHRGRHEQRSDMDLVAVSLTLVAAMLLGVGWVLQQYAAEQAPSCYFLRLRLIVDLLHRRRWLLGLAVMISGQLLSAWSVGHLDLTLYEPLLASSLIFALALAVPLSHQRLKAAEMIGAVILSGGVAALALSRFNGTPSASFGSFSDWPAAAGIAVVAYCFIHAGHLRSGQARATLTGIGTGLVMGISDAPAGGRHRRVGLLLHARRAPAQRPGTRHPDRNRHRPGHGHI